MTRFPTLAACAAFVLVALAALPALAHPLGNFTINHLAVVSPGPQGLRIHYVLDIAEIPAFQIMHASDGWTTDRIRQWNAEEAARVQNGFSLNSGGRRLPMTLVRSSSTTRPGAGGLPTLYWTGDYSVALGPGSVTAQDGVYADRRIGWKDIVLPGTSDPTNALRSYPPAALGSPRRNDSATFVLSARGFISAVRVFGSESTAGWDPASAVRAPALSDLFSRSSQTPLLVLITVLAAFGLGALHGLEPGHGKALLAFTLVGARATFKQAVILAAALTFAHTIAVVLLGLVLFFAAGFATERIFAWITLGSGIAVAVIGARALANAASRTAHEHQPARAHAHGHDHAHGHQHAHAIPGKAPLHFPSAVVAAMSGGIAPCPAAIVVLLTALHLHRIGYGLFLIVVFSLGLAAVLAGVGLAVVRGAAWLQRRSGYAQVAAIAPYATACVISIIGSVMLAQGLVDAGASVPAVAVITTTLAAIAAVAIFPPYLSTRSTHRTLAIKETP